MRFGYRIAFAWMLAAGWARAGEGLLPDGHLDSAAVRDAYLRADMAFVIGVLEGYIKTHPKDVPAAEKIFTHSYLGAAYSGEPGGKPRSDAHFRAALRLDPDADPAGLYLSPAIKARFEELRAAARAERKPDLASAPGGGMEALGREPRTAGVPVPDSAGGARQGLPAPEGGLRSGDPGMAAGIGMERGRPAAPGSVRDEGARGWLWWTLGGTAAAAAVGAGALGWILADSEAQPRRVRVDATLK